VLPPGAAEPVPTLDGLQAATTAEAVASCRKRRRVMICRTTSSM
jgi:hypothetical protein